MSNWQITVTAGAYDDLPGTGVSLVMDRTSGDIPPGTFIITGADDGSRIRLSVRQHDDEGRFVTSAEHVLDRAEKALHGAEAQLEDVAGIPGAEAAR